MKDVTFIGQDSTYFPDHAISIMPVISNYSSEIEYVINYDEEEFVTPENARYVAIEKELKSLKDEVAELKKVMEEQLNEKRGKTCSCDPTLCGGCKDS